MKMRVEQRWRDNDNGFSHWFIIADGRIYAAGMIKESAEELMHKVETGRATLGSTGGYPDFYIRINPKGEALCPNQ